VFHGFNKCLIKEYFLNAKELSFGRRMKGAMRFFYTIIKTQK